MDQIHDRLGCSVKYILLLCGLMGSCEITITPKRYVLFSQGSLNSLGDVLKAKRAVPKDGKRSRPEVENL